MASLDIRCTHTGRHHRSSNLEAQSANLKTFICISHHSLLTFTMGAYKYLQELQNKKQSDVLRFLLRVR